MDRLKLFVFLCVRDFFLFECYFVRKRKRKDFFVCDLEERKKKNGINCGMEMDGREDCFFNKGIISFV